VCGSARGITAPVVAAVANTVVSVVANNSVSTPVRVGGRRVGDLVERIVVGNVRTSLDGVTRVIGGGRHVFQIFEIVDEACRVGGHAVRGSGLKDLYASSDGRVLRHARRSSP